MNFVIMLINVTFESGYLLAADTTSLLYFTEAEGKEDGADS